MAIKYISYTSQNIAGNQSFELGFHASLQGALEFYLEFCENVGTDDCCMSLYELPKNYELRQDMIHDAKEFADVGCPFDCPSKVVERGPRGGVRFVNA